MLVICVVHDLMRQDTNRCAAEDLSGGAIDLLTRIPLPFYMDGGLPKTTILRLLGFGTLSIVFASQRLANFLFHPLHVLRRFARCSAVGFKPQFIREQ